MQATRRIVGVDVAKEELVVAVHTETRSGKVANSAQAISTWLGTLERGSVVAMEATGKYHRLLAELAHAAGMRVFVLNARDVHFYAKALGARGKTAVSYTHLQHGGHFDGGPARTGCHGTIRPCAAACGVPVVQLQSACGVHVDRRAARTA